MEYNIKILSAEDAVTYQQLRLKSYQNDPFAFSESYEDEKTRPLSDFEKEVSVIGNPPEWFVLGAFLDDKELAGFVKFRRDVRSKARHKSMIHAMYVDPDYRSFGVGKRLIEELLQQVRELQGLEQIHLWVLHSSKSTSASGFYSRCGFESQGTRVIKDLKVDDTYVDAEYMVMYLDEQ